MTSTTMTGRRHYVDANTAEWRLVDGEAVIVHVQSSHYYALNETGTLVWTLLAEGALTADEVSARVAEAYAVPVERVADDVSRVITELHAEGLLQER